MNCLLAAVAAYKILERQTRRENATQFKLQNFKKLDGVVQTGNDVNRRVVTEFKNKQVKNGFKISVWYLTSNAETEG